MDNITLNLVNFALSMHTVKQSVASKNIANVDFQNKLSVDFSEHLKRIESMSADNKLDYLQILNGQNLELQSDVVSQTNVAINIETEHAQSTKAMIEYQALVEAVNRKIGMMALVSGGQR
jgi:flagellar basal-body rod protein FlgB